jgi:hypothetical protein
MAYKSQALAIPLMTFASSALTTSYQAFSPATLPNAIFCLVITNGSSTSVTISYDGTNDHEYMLSGGTKVINFATNASPVNYTCLMAQGTGIYVKGTAGTGQIAISGYYQPVNNQ